MKLTFAIIAAAFAAALLLFGCAAQGQKACTAEAKLCPDGSAVGRTGPNCEFAPCPVAAGNGSQEAKEAGFCSKDSDCQYYWYAAGCYTLENMKAMQEKNAQLGLRPAEARPIPGASCLCEKNACKMVVPPANGMTKERCISARGNWNECASACRGAPEGTACTMQCVQQCECGGIAGFVCPEGYYCTDYLPKDAADAMGVCRPIG